MIGIGIGALEVVILVVAALGVWGLFFKSKSFGGVQFPDEQARPAPPPKPPDGPPVGPGGGPPVTLESLLPDTVQNWIGAARDRAATARLRAFRERFEAEAELRRRAEADPEVQLALLREMGIDIEAHELPVLRAACEQAKREREQQERGGGEQGPP